MSATSKRAPRAPQKKDWAPRFLEVLRECPDVSKAAAAVGIQRSTAYRRRQADEDFALAWSDAHAVSLDELEAALFRRAKDTDTTAAIFLLKSHRPDIYRENVKVEHSGSVKTDLSALSTEELQAIADGLDAKRAGAR
jgi:hypothetical protein